MIQRAFWALVLVSVGFWVDVLLHHLERRVGYAPAPYERKPSHVR